MAPFCIDLCCLDACLCMLLQAAPNQAPDVWLQLLQHCAAADTSCHLGVIKSLTEQVAEQQQQQLVEQQQQLVEQQQQNAEQQQQLAALQEVVSRQGAQLQALQVQVQSSLQGM